jgi:uncharacterized protein
VKFLKVNVADIQREISAAKEFEGELLLTDITWQGESLDFKGPLQIKGRIVNGGEVLVLTADVRSTVILQCGSCMESYEQNLDFSFEARLRMASEEETPDYFLYEGNEIDLSDIILEFLLLELPIQRRCREDCKGLCPECGTNLNHETCECSKQTENDPDLAFDERLQALKDYFSTEGKEV